MEIMLFRFVVMLASFFCKLVMFLDIWLSDVGGMNLFPIHCLPKQAFM